jgi:hypothetical protein
LIICEFSDRRTIAYGYKANEIFIWLEAHNYKWFRIVGDQGLAYCEKQQYYDYDNLIACPNEKIGLLEKRITVLPNLLGDRFLEWGFVLTRVGKYLPKNHSRILDFGSGDGFLAIGSASLGVDVLSIDLLNHKFGFEASNVHFQQMDLMEIGDEYIDKFDIIINCSTIEHVGISGRYGSQENPDGDLIAMKKIFNLLSSNGYQLLTLPVGKDRVIRPFHRIYGINRFSALINNFKVLEEYYWLKNNLNIWIECSKEDAFSEEGNDHYYAIGMFVLSKIMNKAS